MVSAFKTKIRKPDAICIPKAMPCLLLLCYIIGFWTGKSFLTNSHFLMLFAGADAADLNASGWAEAFSSSFLSKSAFLLFMVTAGLSAVGTIVIPSLFAVKGLGFGVASASLWKTAGKTGLVQIWIFHWLPEAILLGMLLCLADAAWPLSQKLGRICFTSKGTAMPLELRQRLLGRYLILQICEIGICFLSIRSQILLAGLFR